MVDLTRWLKRQLPSGAERSSASSDITGFVYVGRGDSGPMAAAAPGLQVGSFVDAPPWIVVDHNPQSTILAKWPGRLWKVRVLHKAAEQPRSYAGYTRATVVDVLDEAPLAVLFEHNGDAVVEFLTSISRLQLATVEALRESQDEEAVGFHNMTWDRWLASVDPGSPHLGAEHAGIIAVGAKAPSSPVGNATSVLHSELWKRAREIAGDRAFVVEDEEVFFNATWSRVAACLQHALFALGAGEHLLSASERAVLLRAYEKATRND